jgi:hypothetical protein
MSDVVLRAKGSLKRLNFTEAQWQVVSGSSWLPEALVHQTVGRWLCFAYLALCDRFQHSV